MSGEDSLAHSLHNPNPINIWVLPKHRLGLSSCRAHTITRHLGGILNIPPHDADYPPGARVHVCVFVCGVRESVLWTHVPARTQRFFHTIGSNIRQRVVCFAVPTVSPRLARHPARDTFVRTYIYVWCTRGTMRCVLTVLSDHCVAVASECRIM